MSVYILLQLQLSDTSHVMSIYLFTIKPLILSCMLFTAVDDTRNSATNNSITEPWAMNVKNI